MKRFFRNLPIKHKLMVLTVAISGVALLIACAAFAFNEQAGFRRTMARDFAILADMFDDNVAPGLAFNDPASIEQTLKTLSANRRIVAACVYNQQGTVVGAYRRAEGSVTGAEFKFPVAQPTSQRFGEDRLDTFQDVTLAGEVIGVVYIGTDLDELRERAWRYGAIVGLLLAGCSLVVLLLVSRFQRIISQPIVDLAHTVATVATEKDYAVRAHKQSDDELGRLIDGFNEMLAQIQARDAALRSAHQLLEKRVEERTTELQNENAERRRAEENLQAKSALLEAQTEASLDGILVVDTEGRKVIQNQRVIDLWKIPPELATELNDEQQVKFVMGQTKHPDLFAGKVKYLYAHPNEKSRDEIEFKDGTVLDRYSGPVIGKDGRQYGRIWMFRDITKRRQAEEALQESEERFSGAFEYAPIGVALVSPSGHWLKVNRAICALVGYSEAELLTRTFQDITHPEDLENDLTYVNRMIAGEIKSYQMEKRYVHSKGHLVTVLLNVSLVRDGQGQPRYFISQIQDISERKQADAALDQAHKEMIVVSRRAGMAEVATGVLHNVGNVLNSVNVSATLIAKHVRSTKAGSVEKIAALFDEHKSDLAEFLTKDPRGRLIPGYLRTLAESIKIEQKTTLEELAHLRKNIEHIKEIVAMQQSNARNSGFLEMVPLTELVEDALRMNASSTGRPDVELVRDYQIRPEINTDRHKIVQILVNLVRNAKFACDDTERADKRITMRIEGDAQAVRIVVSDNGVGIPAENLIRIFNHGFTTRKTGHGFGLHNSALAATEVGGSLRVQSNGPGTGATFTLELPLESNPPAAATEPREASNQS